MKKTLIKNASLLDRDKDYEQLDLLIEDERIVKTAPQIEDSDAEVLNLTGKTLLPMFIDAHVHVVERNVMRGEMLRAFAKNGVAAVRDLGILGDMDLEPYMAWLKEHQGAEYTQVLTAGRYIDVDGGYGMGPEPSMRWGIVVENKEQAVEKIRYEHSLGTHGLKLGFQDGLLGPVAGRMPSDIFHAMVEEAKSLGMWTTAHIGRTSDLKEIVECGIGDAAHTPQDEMISDDLIRTMIEKKISMTTTVGNPEKRVKQMRKIPPLFNDDKNKFLAWKIRARDVVVENLRRFFEAGGTILAGTDLMHIEDAYEDAAIPAGEMRYLKSIGMSVREVIAACTINPASACNINDLGLIKEGMRACLFAIDGKVNDDFENLIHPPFVMNRGEIL